MILLPLLLIALAGCSPLAAFDAVVPKDAVEGQVVGDVRYREGPRGLLDIYGATDPGAEKPVIFFIYGGSWSRGAKENYSFAGRALASRGYVTVIADYRLVPEVRYPGFVEDAAAALGWVEENIGRYGGDSDRLFLVGHSAGAYNAVMLAMAPQLLGEEGLSPEIIDGVAALSGPYDFLPLDVESTIAAFGEVEDLEATQPVNLPVAGAPPILLIHGADDTLVYPRNSRALAQHIEEGGGRAELIIYDGLDHADTLLTLSRIFRDDAPILERIDAFFKNL
jgi:acetyl esterase/lipase